MATADNDRSLAGIISAATRVEPREMRATALSFLFVFVLMAAYFILRPVRDAMASDFSNEELSWLWTGTFLFSVPAVALYGAVIPHVRFDHLVPSVYAFFAATFLAFYFGASALPDAGWLDQLFYVWLSVFSLFHVSVTLAVLPVLMIGGWLLIAAAPVLIVIVGLQIARRAGNYAITRPGREMLFTLVDDEMRYKAKPVIDIVVYRGGDMVTAWAYTGITAAFALELTGIAIIAAAVAAVWALAGFSMGRRYDRAPDKPAVAAGTGSDQ